MSETLTTLGFLIAVLTSQLSHDRYHRREAATGALTEVGPVAMLHLHVVQQSPDLERSARAKRIVKAFIQGNAEWMTERTRPTNYHQLPWIDLDSLLANRHYVQMAIDMGVSNASPDWPAYRTATRIWMLEQYRAGYPPRYVVFHLDRMVSVELQWIREHGARYGLKVSSR